MRDLTITRGARRAALALLILVFLTGGGNLWASWIEVQHQAAAQRREQVLQQEAGAILDQKLCATFGRLAANTPPAGNPEKNPSRAYEQRQAVILNELGTDLGCKAGK